jgi:eukaryotic-like serine/threonine-protein kinase
MAFRPPTPGVLLDNKYRLAERIGGGGMGDVFRAENVLAGREVAIKFLHAELAQNEDLAQRFFQEAQAVNRIRHPNIVDVLDAGVGEMGPYIAMEYLEGESVGACLLRLGRFDAESTVGVAIPVLEALDAAHRVGIIHRDLKPENVFIAFEPVRGTAVVRLLDFGIAKMLDAAEPSPRTRTGVVFGTPDYLSPEQATGEAPLDGRSDLFAVGVLLYELLSGTRPFRAATAVATAFRVVHADPPALAGTGVHVDPKVEAVVFRLLQKDPARRYPTAGDVVRELERVLPDPARRLAALGRMINVAKRAVAYSMQADRREPPARLVSPDSVSSGVASLRPISSPTRSLLAESLRMTRATAAAEPAKPRWTPPEPSVRSTDLSDAPTKVTPRSTPVRPFPARFVGRFQVRGPVLRAVDKGVVDMFGPKTRDEIVSLMPSKHSAEFVNDSINALVAYDLEALDSYMEVASSIAIHDLGRWRDLGRSAVDGELQQVVRTLLRPSVDLSSVMRRGVSIWARLFTFGAWRVSSATTGKVELHMTEFDPVSLPLRLWVIGMVEQTARRAMGTEVKATITLGELSFTPELACEIG